MEPFLKISARENAAVKIYRKLASSRKERMREQRFVLEGLRLVGDAVKNGAALTHLFWTEDGYARWQAEQIQADLRETRCALISNELGKELSQTEHSQGVYAICRMPQQPALCDLVHAGGIYAVLHQLQDPGNAGMVLRTADALGLDGVIYGAMPTGTESTIKLRIGDFLLTGVVFGNTAYKIGQEVKFEIGGEDIL